MPATPAPLFATEAKAAMLLDMKPADFRDLVAKGHLPRGQEIAPGFIRWPVDDLRRIASGDLIEGEIEW